MNRTLVLTRPGRIRARRIMLRRQAIVFSLSYLALAIVGIFLLDLHGFVQLTGVVALGIVVVGVLLSRAAASPNVSFQGWALQLDEHSICLPGNVEETVIRRDDIRSLSESPTGLVVRGGSPPHRLWIPAGVEHYADVKRTLESWLRKEHQPT